MFYERHDFWMVGSTEVINSNGARLMADAPMGFGSRPSSGVVLLWGLTLPPGVPELAHLCSFFSRFSLGSPLS